MKKFNFIFLSLVGIINFISIIELNNKIDDSQIALGRLGELIVNKKLKKTLSKKINF